MTKDSKTKLHSHQEISDQINLVSKGVEPGEVFTMHGMLSVGSSAYQQGKTLLMNNTIEAALERGETVAIVSVNNGTEIRGASTAKDITPVEPKRIK